MSYEYLLIFADSSLPRHVMDILRRSNVDIKQQEQEICLKDAELKGAVDYYIRLI